MEAAGTLGDRKAHRAAGKAARVSDVKESHEAQKAGPGATFTSDDDSGHVTSSRKYD